MSEELDEIARRIKAARYPCQRHEMPCSACNSMVFQGCIWLAEAVLTPIVEPELETT